MRRWSRRARALGGSLVEVLQAEVHSLLADFQRTGKGAVRGLSLLLLAAAIFFWCLGLLVTFAVALLATRLGVWQATGVCLLGLAAIGAAVALWGWRCFKGLEAPTRIVRNHVDDHVQWWRETLAPPASLEEPEVEGPAGEESR